MRVAERNRGPAYDPSVTTTSVRAARRATIALALAALALTAADAPAVTAKPKSNAMPSLKVTRVTAMPSSVATGEVLELRSRIVNTGRARSRRKQTRLRIYVRPEPGSPNGAQFANVLLGSIRAGEERRERTELTMPASPTGDFYFAACVNRRGNTGPQRCAVTDAPVSLTGPAALLGF